MIRIMSLGFLAGALALSSAAGYCGGNDKDPHAHHRKMMEQQSQADANFTDIDPPNAVLANQDGVNVNLKSDVIRDRIVVVDFVYTTCTTVCPVLSAVFRQVQSRLEDRLGDEVVMISISVDPNRDTPARLKSYAAKFEAGEDWVWLTGRKQTVTEVLEEFGAYTPNFADHPSMVLVGDGRSGKWARFIGFPAPEQIVGKVNEFSAERAAQQAHAGHGEH